MIEDLTSLIDAVEDYLARGDLKARIPTFLQFAERRIHRRLDISDNETMTRLDLVGGRAPLPNDYAAWRAVLGSWGGSLDYLSPHAFIGRYGASYGLRRRQGDGYDYVADGTACNGGRPGWFTIIGSVPLDDVDADPSVWIGGLDQPFLLVGPAGNGEISIVYRQGIPPLTEAEPTNRFLLKNPDLYLYGILLETEPFMKNDARLATWKVLFEEALDNITTLDRAARWGRARMVASEPTP
jgi:hypothetical protein